MPDEEFELGPEGETEASPDAAPKDRKKWLVAVGVFEMLLALLFLFGLAGMLAAFVNMPDDLGREAGAPAGMRWGFVIGALMQGLIAAALVWHAVGVIRARRWARALGLIFAWLAAASVAYAALLMLLTLIGGSRIAGFTPAMVPSLIVFVVMLGLALLFVRFFGSKSVKATCERRDLKERWTDKRPLPVVGMVLVLALSAPSFVLSALGGVLTLTFGNPEQQEWLLGGAVLQALLAAAAAALCYGAWKLRPWAWWGALGLVMAAAAYTLGLTWATGSMNMFVPVAMPAEQAAMMRRIMTAQQPVMVWSSVIAFVAALLYLTYVQRYFFPVKN